MAREQIMARGVIASDVVVESVMQSNLSTSKSFRREALAWMILTPLLSIAVLTVSGFGYLLSAIAVAVALRAHPVEEEHRRQIEDEVCAAGGAVVVVMDAAYQKGPLLSALRNAGAMEVETRESI